MLKTRKTRCPYCGFLDVIKCGKQCGHQRHKCNNCQILFIFRRKDVSQANRLVRFERWIIRKQTISQISELSGHSERQLYCWFDEYLKAYSKWEIQRREKVNLLIDGMWFPNKMCLIVYRDDRVETTLFYRLTDDEWESR